MGLIMSLIFVYSIPRKTSTGLSEMTSDVSGKKLQKVKMGRCKDGIQALYSSKVGGLANYISYTPWTEDGKVKTDASGTPLTLQDKMELKWNKPKGFFTNANWIPGSSMKEEDLTYFQRKRWKLGDGCTVFDTNEMDAELGYYVCLGSSLVANSEREYLSHKWPKAQWYIALENESDEIKYSKNEIKSKAYASLHGSELTTVYKRKIVSLLDLASSRAALTDQQIHNLLFDFIEKSGFTPGSNIDKFMELITLLSTPLGREQFEAKYILKQALDCRIIIEKQSTYTWPKATGAITLGETYREAIEFIMNPKKSGIVEDLMNETYAKLLS
jgi:hypothetical protein